ncbi:MAG: extracellular solute-binding protein, partial [Rhodospirillales bacterium]
MKDRGGLKNIVGKGLLSATIGIAVFAGSADISAQAAEELNLYSYRQPFLITPLTEAFTAETGIKVNLVYAKSGVLERLKAEGEHTPADVVLTVDIGRLKDMVDAGVLAEVSSDLLAEKIPAHLRDPKGLWFGLTQRSRVIFASKDRVPADEPLTYEGLADPKWKGRICFRSGKHDYNVSLIAAMIAHHGLEETRTWLKAVKANLARKPQGNDRGQAKAIKEGECDLGLGNTYYYGKMATNDDKPEEKSWADAVRVVFPNQKGAGAHMNVSGAGVVKYSQRKETAVRFIEFLVGKKAQTIYAQQNFEYPVADGVEVDPVTAALGAFKADTIS